MKNLFASTLTASVLLAALAAACSSSGKTACAEGSACGAGKIQSCAVSDSTGGCANGYYKTPDGKVFNWASCNDTTAAVNAVNAYCAAAGDAGGTPDAATEHDAADDAAAE